MNCAYHSEVESVAFCVSCGNAVCAPCRRSVEGSAYCENCLGDLVRRGVRERSPTTERPTNEQQASGSGSADSGSYSNREAGRGQPNLGGENPGAAFALGLIPGVGAIYNGELFKAAVQILVFGLIVSLNDAVNGGPGEAIFALMGVGFYFYMPFDAYYTAKKRNLLAQGIDLETPIDRFHQQFGEIENKELWGGLALVALGVLFLADNFFAWFRMSQVLDYWPLALIVTGVWLVFRHREGQDIPRQTANSSMTSKQKEDEERRGA